MGADFGIIIRWWGTLFLVGSVAFPLTRKMFPSWHDRGYFFAKAVGMAAVTYLVYLLGILHWVPFTVGSIWLSVGLIFALGMSLHIFHKESSPVRELHGWQKKIGVIFFEEVFFFLALLFWSWIKGHEASVHGLEKFMDYGFMQSILNSRWFPAVDIWYTPLPINYYYFGHTVVAMLTKLSGLDLSYTFNLMLASLFAFTLTMSYSIGLQLLRIQTGRHIGKIMQISGALLTGFLTSLGGNMQTLYAFTRGYTGEDVKPFWQLAWPLQEFWSKLPEGLERYWYANATRFIPFTIHEFPSYSFVVSDVHGHVMSLPFTLLAIALLVQLFGGGTEHDEHVRSVGRTKAMFSRQSLVMVTYIFYGVLVSVLLMTNALDGPIYLGLFIVLFFIDNGRIRFRDPSWWKTKILGVLPVVSVAALTSIPFMRYFSSFVSGLAVNCPPAFIAGRKIGPLLFEGVEKCQHSPLWMMWLLWGFFIYCGAWLMYSMVKKFLQKNGHTAISRVELVLGLFFCFSLLLIIFPEFFYFKDIYPAHFRSNTMFKLGYQAFIMFSLISGYSIIQTLQSLREKIGKRQRVWSLVFLVVLLPQLFLVSIYPVFSVRSYFDSLRTYKGLDGLTWLKEQYPDDYEAIHFLRRQIADGSGTTDAPVIVEADGDSYTDYARYSAFTGFPSVIGWPVHEWLWRGTYDVVAPRREEVRILYESEDVNETMAIIHKYGVKYIIVSGFEREKFTALNMEKIEQIATLVYVHGNAAVYRVNERP